MTLADGLPVSTVRCITQDTFGFLWMGTKSGLVRYDGHHMTTYEFHPDHPEGLSSGGIIYLEAVGDRYLAFSSLHSGLYLVDRTTGALEHHPFPAEEVAELQTPSIAYLGSDFLYLGSLGGGLARFDLRSKTYTFIRQVAGAKNSLFSNNVTTVVAAPQGRGLFLGFGEGAVGYYDIAQETFDQYLAGAGDYGSNIDARVVQSICLSTTGDLWIGYQGLGITRFDPRTRERQEYGDAPLPSGMPGRVGIDGIVAAPDGDLWIKWRTNGGLVYYDRSADTFSLQRFSPGKVNPQNTPSFRSLFVDKDGILWAGTIRGVSYARTPTAQLPDARSTVHLFNPQPPGTTTKVLEDSRGNTWATVEDDGLYRLPPNGRRWEKVILSDQTAGELILPVAMTEGPEGHIWFGLLDNGLLRYDPVSEQFRRYSNEEEYFNIYENIAFDAAGNFWAATYGGISRLDQASGQFENHVISIPNDPLFPDHLDINDLVVEDADNIWCATYAGLLKYSATQRRVTERYGHDFTEPNSLSHFQVFTLAKDATGTLWIGTAFGLNALDPGAKTFRRYLPENGLPHKRVKGLQIADEEGIWIYTVNGSAFLNPTTGTMNRAAFAPDSCFASRDPTAIYQQDRLFLAGCPNLLYLTPPTGEEVIPYPLEITGFKYFSAQADSVVVGKEWRKGATFTLENSDNSLEFSFSAIGPGQALEPVYSYRIIGVDDNWISLGDRNSIILTGLTPGRYTLEITEANALSLGLAAQIAVPLIISPPWYQSWWANALFSLLVLGGLLFLLWWLRRRSQVRQLEKFRDFQAELFGNIAHELRTPLTLIKAYASGNSPTGQTPRKAINRQVDGMIELIDRLLQIDRLQEIRHDIVKQEGDILACLRESADAFSQQMHDRQLTFLIDVQSEPVIVRYSDFAWKTICNNLLSNAVKFSSAGDTVSFSANIKAGELVVEVTDTGSGIPDDRKERIFERYTRLYRDRKVKGHGIGLAYVSALLEQMGGTVSVQDNEPKGSRFIVHYPIQPLDFSVPVTAAEAGSGSRRPEVLVIEDHREMAAYVKSCLQDTYLVRTSHTGDEGIDTALATVPDAIITDLMLPGTDGIEITRRLKNDYRTSHIPVILLTARSLQESRLAGLRAGADAYLTKPFDPQELRAHLDAQLKLRHRLSEHFFQQARTSAKHKGPHLAARAQVQGSGRRADTAPQPSFPEAPPGQLKIVTSMPEREVDFLDDLKRHILAELDRVELNAEALAPKVAMSRTQLYRKLQALTGLSVNLYIRKIRLEVAAERLVQSKASVQEIAYATGFSSPKYLSRLFKEAYGASPRDFRRGQ